MAPQTARQRCRAWLRLHGIKSKRPAPSDDPEPAGHDSEPPPYHDLRTTTGPAADLASITSAISTVAVTTVARSGPLSFNTMNAAKLICRMAHAIANTPHARDYHRLSKDEDGDQISVTGTVETLMTGIDSYINVVLTERTRGDCYFWASSCSARYKTLFSICTKAKSSPLASARIIIDNLSRMAIEFEWILTSVRSVVCLPAVAAAITTALISVANTIAAAPEESMIPLAELYSSYADQAALGIVQGIIDAQSLVQDGGAPAASITKSRSSGPKSSTADKSLTETTTAEDDVKRLRKEKKTQRPGPLTRKDRRWNCDCTPVHL